MPTQSYDSWKLDSPVQFKKRLCKCGYCKTALHKGDEAIPYRDSFYCSEECYQEKLVAMNEPNFIKLTEEAI
ncbi:hypothetical protein [Bacillus solitudinis]|uniref:hypothetical protein n=1 Tax=Bacillus solitudinis TaxID=2014074 RepID=UPI000C23070D|nr:hypothetical protein [Bacillus solitudinis]